MAATPGLYNKRMRLMQPSLGAASATGEQVAVGVEIAKMWCALVPLQGREYFASAQVQAETTHTIRTWYRTDIAPDSTMWLLYGSRRFDIESVVNVDESSEEFLIRVHERH